MATRPQHPQAGYALHAAHPTLAHQYYTAGYWRAEDLWTSIETVAARKPQATAFIEGERAIGFGELLARAQCFGTAALRRGLTQGDIVVIHGRNCIEAAIAMLGCAYACLPFALLPPMFSVKQISGILDNTGARMIVGLGDPGDIERTREAAQAAALDTTVVADGTALDGAIAWSDFMALGERLDGARQPMTADDLALLIYSSGTTGTPKGVMHSANTARFAAEQFAAFHDIKAGDTCLVVLEFGFVASSILGVIVSMLKGCTTVLLRHWKVDDALELIQRHRASYIFLMPTHAIDMLASPQLDRTDCSSVRRGVLAGLTETLRSDAKQRLCAKPFPMYGMSESPAHVTGAMADGWDKLRNTEGKALTGTEVLICDDNDTPLPAGEKGNILVRGPNRFLGYCNEDQLTAEALTTDGYFKTGDIGFVDDDGYVTFVSRNKDIIRRGGVTVVPSEIEAALRPHPRISDIAVIGVPDARLGERACACVITRDSKDMPLEEITGFLEQNAFARYLWPEYVYVCDRFPRTPSLKVKKNELRDEVLARLNAGA